MSTFALGKRANLDLGFADVLGKIPDAPLYIFPSVTAYHAIPGHRLEELLSKVRDGAVLYVSIDTELFRRTPEIFGFECLYRRRVSGVKNVILNGATYPMGYGSEFSIEPRSAEVLARDENGEPVFLVNSYGKGKIFFFAMALERYLLDRDGAFFRENEPDYAAFYRLLSSAAGIDRAIESSSPFIRLTEHPLPDGRAFITAINYSMRPETARLSVKNGTLTEVFGTPLRGDILDLEPDSGAIFLYEKNKIK